MVYHFEAQKFLHVCIPQRARERNGGEERERERERAQSKGTEGQRGKKRERGGSAEGGSLTQGGAAEAAAEKWRERERKKRGRDSHFCSF